MNRKWIAGGISLCLLGAGIFVAWSKLRAPEPPTRKITFSQPLGGDFSLPSTEGRFDTLNERGKVIFLFFGFTRCPHICPTTLANLSAMLNGLPPRLAGQAKAVFVSIDPERDSLDLIRTYTSAFRNKYVVGATDSDESLRRIAGLFGASYSRFQAQDGTPLVDHTSDVFVINQRGEWVSSLPFNSDPAEFRRAFEIAVDMRPQVERLHPLRDLEEIGRNDACDIGAGDCEISLDEHSFKLTTDPRPPRQGKKIRVNVTASHPKWEPILLDLVGIERDMGYLRPTLTSSGKRSHFAQFEIPVCEIPSMHWHVRLVLKNEAGSMAALTYLLRTDAD